MVDCCLLSQECAVVFPSAVGGYFHHTSPKRQRRSRPDESPCRKPQAVIKNINFVDSLPLASVDFPIAAYTSRMLDFLSRCHSRSRYLRRRPSGSPRPSDFIPPLHILGCRIRLSYKFCLGLRLYPQLSSDPVQSLAR